MVFSSVLFLFLFLPVVVSVYHASPRFARNLWLLAASLFFYAWGETFYVGVMLVSVLANYGLGLAADRFRGGPFGGRILLLTVLLNLGMLGVFKYANFIADNVNVALATLGLATVELSPVHLPIGISFFTFQAMSYVIDVYRGQARVERNPFNVALYIALFPQLIAGPIVRYQDVADQIRERSTSADLFAQGIRRFVIGLGKKVLIANLVAVPADAIFQLPASELTTGLAWLGTICYTLQIYFDFSGYSDMAIGLGLMFGFRFLENFQWPYIARSIKEFWRRWHISLSTWFRDYLYLPLGGNRHGNLRTYFNLVTVFFLCGLWHGASWSFVVWGLYHGAFLVFERTRAGAVVDRMPRPLQHGYTLIVVMIGWVFFRHETLPGALHHLAAMAGFDGGAVPLYPVGYYLQYDLCLALALGIFGATPWLPALAVWYERQDSPALRRAGDIALIAAPLAVLYCAAVVLSAGTHNPFIYFRF
ncbi:MAG: MBOAT family protein [Candidatus Hydrogenedens sp.]|nr:MBOAT family protein [Candidatus Hydrogenedens sp.]